jgi:DNA-directed RNA polymerase sigma subunit (sigma70/sigma32)
MVEALAGSSVIRIPPRARRQLAAVRRTEDALAHADHQSPTTAAIAAQTGFSVNNVRSLRTVARVTTSLEEPVGDGNTALADLLVDESAVDPAQRAIVREELSSLRALLRLLPERHRAVLERRYGLRRQREQSHAEIGASLGIGEERCRQLEREALHRLRTIAAADRGARSLAA